MLHLTKVLPVRLKLNHLGKKVPLGGMNKANRVDYRDDMENFAIYMEDYPDIVVLDLDTRPHALEHYKDITYTHKTRKGWHCFFKNTYNMTNKRQNQKEKFDVLCGKNWIFYDYDDPDVAQYTEYNQLPLVDMPPELYDKIKIKASDVGEAVLDEYIVEPLMHKLKSNKSLFDQREKRWIPGLTIGENGAEYDSSALAWGLINELLAYTDEPLHISKFLKLIPSIAEKHSTIPYLTQYGEDQGSIGKAKKLIYRSKSLNYRPLSDFRAVSLSNKTVYADINQQKFRSKQFVDMYVLKHTDIDLLNEFVASYPEVAFRPDLPNKFNKGVYNLFNGFIEPHEGNGHEQYLEFIRKGICSDNEEHYNYLMDYMAHMVQKPTARPDVAIVLYGHDKGTGKDTFHQLLGRIFMNGGYSKLTEETLMGRFNRPMEDCLLGYAEELVFGGSHKEDSKLKSLITSSTHTIERKGFESYEVSNFIRLVVTSNSSRPVKATDGERRYFALTPSLLYKADFQFWDDLYTNFDASNLLYFLQHRYIEKFQPRNIPHSEHLSTIVEENKDQLTVVIEDWWDNVYDDHVIITKELYDMMEFDKRYITLRQFTSRLFSVCGKGKFKKSFNGKLGNHYVITDHKPEPKFDEDFSN